MFLANQDVVWGRFNEIRPRSSRRQASNPEETACQSQQYRKGAYDRVFLAVKKKQFDRTCPEEGFGRLLGATRRRAKRHGTLKGAIMAACYGGPEHAAEVTKERSQLCGQRILTWRSYSARPRRAFFFLGLAPCASTGGPAESSLAF